MVNPSARDRTGSGTIQLSRPGEPPARTVGLEELLELLASRVPPGVPLRMVLSIALEAIRGELLAGRRVELPGLPPLEPEAAWCASARTGGEAPDRDLPAVVLFVPEITSQVDLIIRMLSGKLYTAAALDDRELLEVALASRLPEVLVLDRQSPGALELVAELKLDPRFSRTALIVLYHAAEEPQAASGLRIREDEGLVAPYRIEQLLEVIEREVARQREDRACARRRVQFEFSTTEAGLEEANELVARLLAQAELPPPAEQALGVAFREAADNAAVHGNRRQTERKIRVAFQSDAEQVTLTVEDEGAGFATETYLTRDDDGRAVARARERIEAGRPGGMGIMLMLRCTDDLEYNDRGNLVRLTRRRPAAEAQGAEAGVTSPEA